MWWGSLFDTTLKFSNNRLFVHKNEGFNWEFHNRGGYCWIKPKYNELQTASNLTGRTSNSLEPRFVHQNQTLSNPSKKTELWNCLARNWPNPGPNLEKLNFELSEPRVRLPKVNYEPTLTLQKSWTSNRWTRFDPILVKNILSILLFLDFKL